MDYIQEELRRQREALSRLLLGGGVSDGETFPEAADNPLKATGEPPEGNAALRRGGAAYRRERISGETPLSGRDLPEAVSRETSLSEKALTERPLAEAALREQALPGVFSLEGSLPETVEAVLEAERDFQREFLPETLETSPGTMRVPLETAEPFDRAAEMAPGTADSLSVQSLKQDGNGETPPPSWEEVPVDRELESRTEYAVSGKWREGLESETDGDGWEPAAPRRRELGRIAAGMTARDRPAGFTAGGQAAGMGISGMSSPEDGGAWERTVTELVLPSGGGMTADPKELSRIFQRDARRYDGGFPLL